MHNFNYLLHGQFHNQVCFFCMFSSVAQMNVFSDNHLSVVQLKLTLKQKVENIAKLFLLLMSFFKFGRYEL